MDRGITGGGITLWNDGSDSTASVSPDITDETNGAPRPVVENGVTDGRGWFRREWSVVVGRGGPRSRQRVVFLLHISDPLLDLPGLEESVLLFESYPEGVTDEEEDDREG